MNKSHKKKIASEYNTSEAIYTENKCVYNDIEYNTDNETDEIVDNILKEHNVVTNEDLEYKNYLYNFLKNNLSKEQIDQIYNYIKYDNFELWVSLSQDYNIIVKSNNGTCYLIQLLKLYNDFTETYHKCSYDQRDKMSTESIVYYILKQKRYYDLSDIVAYRSTDITRIYYLKLLITCVLYEFKKFSKYIKEYKI
jgi:hypothetical protein